MANRVLRRAWGHIRTDCRELRALALRAIDAVGGGRIDHVREYAEAIEAQSTRHLRLVDAFLGDDARRALGSQHNRMVQLVKSLALAVRDANWPQANDYLGRLVAFVGEHEHSEREHIP